MRWLLVLSLCGCDLLFPEFAGSAQDLSTASTDGMTSGSPEIQGQLCALADLRNLASCSQAVPAGMHVSVEETRDQAPVDMFGKFALPLSKMLDVATLAAADPNRAYLPTVTALHLTNGSASNVALPMISANVLSTLALQNGLALDETRGHIFAWIINTQGAPISGVAASGSPLYEGPQASEIGPGNATGHNGLVVYLNVPPGDAKFTVGGVAFTLPVRANAVTISVLIAP